MEKPLALLHTARLRRKNIFIVEDILMDQNYMIGPFFLAEDIFYMRTSEVSCQLLGVHELKDEQYYI